MATHSSGLVYPMDRGAWQATVHSGHKQPDTTEQLSRHIHTYALLCLDFFARHYLWHEAVANPFSLLCTIPCYDGTSFYLSVLP